MTAHPFPPVAHTPTPLDPGPDIERLRELLGALRTAAPSTWAMVLRAVVRKGGGHWVDPAEGQRPASHLFEICVHGVTGCGFTEAEAARSWITAARRITEGDDAEGTA